MDLAVGSPVRTNLVFCNHLVVMLEEIQPFSWSMQVQAESSPMTHPGKCQVEMTQSVTPDTGQHKKRSFTEGRIATLDLHSMYLNLIIHVYSLV